MMSKSVLRATLAVAALAVSSTCALAQVGDPITNPRGTVANFDPVNLGPVLTELGVVWQERTLSNGQRYIAASIGGSLSFNIIPAACLGANATNCVGANIMAVYTGGYANPQSVSAFNQKYPFVSAGSYVDNSGAYISRYEIADYGIARGNVASSLGSFLQLALKFKSEISGANTISADGYADDLSASFLNVKSAEVIGVDAKQKDDGSLSALHLAEFEAAPQLFRVLKESKGVPHNKISNIAE